MAITIPKKIIVKTIDSEITLELDIHKKHGMDLMKNILQTLGIRESWFFGIEIVSMNKTCWLDLQIVLATHNHFNTNEVRVKFKVRFFPPDVNANIIEDRTKELFYYQIKNDILTSKIATTNDTLVLLAAYSIQAKYGSYLLNTPSYAKIFPDTFSATKDDLDKVARFHKAFSKLSRYEAIEKYLSVAQDVLHFGETHYEDSNLIVDAFGIRQDDHVFSWRDIKRLEAKDDQFRISLLENEGSSIKSQPSEVVKKGLGSARVRFAKDVAGKFAKNSKTDSSRSNDKISFTRKMNKKII